MRANPSTTTAMSGPSLRARLGWAALASGLLAADLWSKHVVFYPHVLVRGFREGEVVNAEVFGLSFWRTILVYNQGVTFGMFSSVPAAVKSLLTGIVILWIGWRLWNHRRGAIAEPLSLAMIVGGAVGNLYDRALRPYVEADTHTGVRDFLDWYAPPGTALAEWLEKHEITTHWYTSNVADVLIVCGVILLAITTLREGDPSAAPKDGQPAGDAAA